MPRVSDAVISLGSNLGDRRAYLTTAVELLGTSVRAVSGIYRTPPWGGVEQDDFYNAVVLVSDDEIVDPLDWLDRCRAVEQGAGRERILRWGPRTLDADVIVVGDHLSDDPTLTLPHPRAHERAFVLLPWSEVDPGAELPGFGSIADLLQALPLDGIERIGDL